NRNLHALAAFALDVEAFRRLDVLEVDAAKSRLERADDVDELVRIALRDLDVEAVETGEFLEQHRLALHDRFACERPDGAEPQHGRSVGDHTDQIAARGEIARFAGVADDFVAGCGHARRVRERKVPLVGQLLGRKDRDLAGRMRPMVLERALADILVGHCGASEEKTLLTAVRNHDNRRPPRLWTGMLLAAAGAAPMMPTLPV